MSRYVKSFASVFVFLAALFPIASFAQQVVPAPDKIGILDKATGKEWLPLNYSTGAYFDQVYPTLSVPNQPARPGYKLATDAEVLQLLNDYGFTNALADNGVLAQAFYTLFGASIGWSLPDNSPGIVNGDITMSGEAIYILSDQLNVVYSVAQYFPNLLLDYPAHAIFPDGSCFFLVKNPVSITTPYNFAKPQSNYVALTGTGPVNATIEVLVDGVATLGTFQNTTAKVDTDGDWEKVVYVGQGNHLLKAEDMADTTDASNTIIVETTPPQTSPRTTTDYTLLQKADIFLTRGFNSPQIKYFGVPITGFQYTHTALYLGGDINGTPIVAEAVTAAEGGAYGAVRAVPLEISTVWTDGTTVDIYRPITALSKAQKSAIVTWAQGVTNQGIPYWTGGDFALFFYAWNDWNPLPFFDEPGPSPAYFQSILKALDARKSATNKFICSTLVWHSYYAGTNGIVDLSTPNNATPQAAIGKVLTTKLLHTLQPHFVFPDTLAEDGQLAKVN